MLRRFCNVTEFQIMVSTVEKRKTSRGGTRRRHRLSPIKKRKKGFSERVVFMKGRLSSDRMKTIGLWESNRYDREPRGEET